MASNKKRIAFFSPQLSNVGTGPAMLGIAEGMSKHDFAIDLVAAGTEWATVITSGSGLNVRRVFPHTVASRMPNKGLAFRISILFVSVISLPFLVLYLLRSKPDYVIVGLLPWLGAFAMWLTRSRAALVISVQGLPRKARLRGAIWRRIAGAAEAWVIPASSIRSALEEMVPTGSKIAVIPNPVLDMSKYEGVLPVPAHPWFKEHRHKIVLGAGRLTAQKNFAHLLRSFALLRDKDNTRLVIIGEGEQRRQLEEMASQLGISDRVSMPGYVGNPEHYMAHAGVFVLSSRWEGPGHVLIEALATGVPCVTVDCPYGPSEILGDGEFGRVVDTGDERALAGAIEDALSSPDKARARSLQAKPVLQQYTATAAGASYANLLTEIDAKQRS